MTGFHFDNTFARDMSGFYALCTPQSAPTPRWLQFNRALASELGLDVECCAGDAGLQVFAGNRIPAGAEPLAQVYAGHQFGHFSPQLGDGRALLMGELLDRRGDRRDVVWKGSGRTPFSRGGDGQAAIGPVLREYLMGEAMHALGIPTTRGLAAVSTGETVYRQEALPGAVLVRVAASHLRVGTFEYFAARGERARVQQLADYAIRRHFPELASTERPYWEFLRAVMERQLALIVEWMRVGFIHGVMNTDNMAISGETLDFGPCAFVEMYDPASVYSSIDHRGRYAFGSQSQMAQWDLARLAEALLHLLDDVPKVAADLASELIEEFTARFETKKRQMYQQKLGFRLMNNNELDARIIDDYLELLRTFQVDYTLAFRSLSQVLRGNDANLIALFTGTKRPIQSWLKRWRERIQEQPGTPAEWAESMDAINPRYIPRNRLVEEALQEASTGARMSSFEKLLSVVQDPYREQNVDERYALPGTRIENEAYQTFCGT